MDRRALLTGLALGLPAGNASAPALAASRAARVEEWTFLKATKPDDITALLRFLNANWLAMDRIAVRQGLMTSARLLTKDSNDAADWDAVMQVCYPSDGGYEGIKPAFDAIRARHRVVEPDGRPLTSLGRIVSSHSLLLVAST